MTALWFRYQGRRFRLSKEDLGVTTAWVLETIHEYARPQASGNEPLHECRTKPATPQGLADLMEIASQW